MENLFAGVGEAFNSAFGVDPQTITINIVPSGIPAWDSLRHAVLTTSLEKIFDVAFDVDDLMAMETVKDICRIVQSKLAKVRSVQFQ